MVNARISVLMAAAMLSGCVTAEQAVQQQREQMRSIIGQTMADFTARSGLVPSGALGEGDTRTFVVTGPTVTMTTPGDYWAPTVSNTQTCQILLTSIRTSPAKTGESWRIVDVHWSGPCLGVY